MKADRTPVIVGIGLSDYPKAPHLSEREHHAQALQRALGDSGVNKSDIDGLLTSTTLLKESETGIAEYLGINHKVFGGLGVGGAVPEFNVQQACAALLTGQADTIAITYGSDLFSRAGRSLGTSGPFVATSAITDTTQFEALYGGNIVSNYGMAARRHMHEFGTTSEQLAEIAVAMRYHAGFNPNAMYRDPITVDDVVNSKMVADPLHMLDCCVVSDGGGAIIMTTAERARDLPVEPVFIHGVQCGQTHWSINQMPDFTTTAAAQIGPRLFAESGLTPDQIDVVQLYDSFTITVLMLLEGLGFCERGEGGSFVEHGALRSDGRLPCNTDGGGLSSCHPGMRGIFLLIESVRQLRGLCGETQVDNASLALACGNGGWLSGMGAVIMGTEHPHR